MKRTYGCAPFSNIHNLKMSHLEYPNLAKISDFPERGLNYSGIILDGWYDGPNLYVHLSMLLISLMLGGLPRKGTRLESFWLLLNIIIIHPMDLYVSKRVTIVHKCVDCATDSCKLDALTPVSLVSLMHSPQ